MNERVRELAEQSGLEYNFDPMLWLKYEKFAELIVREICDIVEEDGSAVLPLVIKRHFGIE